MLGEWPISYAEWVMDPTPRISSDVHRSLNPALTLLLRVALYAVAAFSLASTIATLNEVAAFDDLMRTGRSVSVTELAAAEGLTEGFARLAFWVGLAAGGLTIVWWYRAYQVVAAARPTGRTWSARWAVGSWFIPFANMVIPKLVLNEIDRISRAAESGDADWRREPLTVLPHWWWFFWVGGLVLTLVGVGISTGDGGGHLPKRRLPDRFGVDRVGIRRVHSGRVLGGGQRQGHRSPSPLILITIREPSPGVASICRS